MANYPFATIDPNVGIVPVPDNRLKKLSEIENNAPIVPATVKFVDIKSIQPDGMSKFTTYAHAKALVFLANQETFFISGSANFSTNAWLKTGSNTNAEAMLLLRNGDAK